MIAYVATPPEIEPHNGGFLVTFKSGDQPVELMLTRHAAFYLEHKLRKARAEADCAELDKEPIKFPKRKGKR